MVEEIAPEGESSPHGNVLTTSVLISWPNTQEAKAKIGSTDQACLIIFRSPARGLGEDSPGTFDQLCLILLILASCSAAGKVASTYLDSSDLWDA